jgi:UDP-glucose 4-epimerase
MKILIIGGSRFVVKEIISQLLEKNYDVTLADSEGKRSKDYKFIRVNWKKEKSIRRLFGKQYDFCINFGVKIGGISYFNKIPATILSDNNRIYSATFEVAMKGRIKRMIYISSSMVYECTTKFPTKEEDMASTPAPISSYGFSKLIGEKYCISFYKQFGLPYSICRLSNMYGVEEFPGEEAGSSHVIPDLIKKILKSEGEIELMGDGQEIRTFTHVKDIARGIIAVMESPMAENQEFNISTKESIKIIDLAKKIWKICKDKEKFNPNFVKGLDNNVKKRLLDVSKIEKQVGWKAEISLDDGLKEIIEWMKMNL